MVGFLLLALVAASCTDRTPAPGHAQAVALPEYAAAWRTVESTRWAIQLRLAPGVSYVSGPSSAECGPDTVAGLFTEPADSAQIADDATALHLEFVHEPFAAYANEPTAFGWSRPTEWNPDAARGWAVYGEGASSAALLEGNGWIGLGGEPLVKIYPDEDQCRVPLDSASADDPVPESGAEDASCGVVHDYRPRYMAAVRRPSDRCYLVMTRTDGEPVGDIAETVRFIDNGTTVAPLGAIALPMRPDSISSMRAATLPVQLNALAGVVERNAHGALCLTIANPRVPLLTPVHIVTATTPQRIVEAMVAWRPPGGCNADAPAAMHGHGLVPADTGALPAGAIGTGILDARAASVVAGRAEIDVDNDGIMEEFASQSESRDVVLTITSQGQSEPRWRATVPRRGSKPVP
jgi:hypothetical protein